MRYVQRICCAALIVVLALFTGVQGSPAPGGASAQDVAPEDEQPVRAGDADDILAEATSDIPGFGGMFLDEDGNVNLYLQDASEKAQARTAVESVFDADIFEGAAVKVLEADYAFADLHRWRQEMRREVLGLPGVVSLDIDEMRNRITVGLEEMEEQATVEAALEKLGVPRDAVILEQDSPVIELDTLRNRIRPTRGGLQIQRGDEGNCTLGFNAGRLGKGGFVTASHCTWTRGKVDNTAFGQPTYASGNMLGVETADPSFWTGAGCPSGRRCRYSDSAYVEYDSGVQRERKIAKTPLGSITVTGKYRVVAEVALPAFGETLYKVGRSTGRTQGVVIWTCVDRDVPRTDITYQCQNKVWDFADYGDSGSPVFKITNSPANGDVKLYGLLWAGEEEGGYWFSSMYTIQLDLGSLKTCASGFDC